MSIRLLGVLVAPVLFGCAAVVSDGAVPPRDRTPAAATGTVWQWTRTETPTGTIEVPVSEGYTLELAPNGRLLVRADCNRGTGTYRIGTGTIAFAPIATTRMACPPGSLDARFLGDLQRASGFFVEDGQLILELPADAGTMRFTRAQ